MGFLRAFTIIALWILVSFFWVSLGQTKERECIDYGTVESWLKPHPVLFDWYRYYAGEHACDTKGADFFKALASSEALSTKLNQAKVTFDQFYVPISHLLNIDWEKVKGDNAQSIQSDLSIINHSINKTLQKMGAADQDYFRSNVLIDLPSEFAGANIPNSAPKEEIVSRRLNRDNADLPRLPMNANEVTPPPYQQVYKIYPCNGMLGPQTAHLA